MKQRAVYFVLFGLLSACYQAPPQEEAPAPDPATLYSPHLATLTIRSAIDYPTGFKATLYDDRDREELASATAENGQFVLKVPDLATNEVYFLKLEGKRRAFGIDGLGWEERVPVYFAYDASELQLLGKPYGGSESVSKMRFYVEGGRVQAALNKWQEANNNHVAAIENQVAQEASLAGIQSSAKQHRRVALRDGLARISREMIATDTPNVATLFLIYRQNDHRDRHSEYHDIYTHAPSSAKQSKYGADLVRRIQKIHSPVESLALKGDSILADGQLMPLDTARLGEYDYWLLYFWSMRDRTSIGGIPAVNDAVSEVGGGKIAAVFVGVDEPFSRWRERSRELGLEHSYFVRRGARQELINALYLTEVPRTVLMRPDGTVLDDDVDTEQLPALLGQE